MEKLQIVEQLYAVRKDIKKIKIPRNDRLSRSLNIMVHLKIYIDNLIKDLSHEEKEEVFNLLSEMIVKDENI